MLLLIDIFHISFILQNYINIFFIKNNKKLFLYKIIHIFKESIHKMKKDDKDTEEIDINIEE